MALLSTALSRVAAGTILRLDSRIRASTVPFTGDPAPLPHVDSNLWGWVHFGVFLPLLPEPYRYLNTMTLIGNTGTELFDNDAMVRGDARRFSTVFSSTARDNQVTYEGFAGGEYDASADGSVLAWGDRLRIGIDGNAVSVAGRYDTFEVDVRLDVTDHVSWFVKTPNYQHWSRLASYEGEVRDETGTTPIAGLGTFEYARAMTQQSLSSRPLPAALKLPMDLFTYQIIAIDDRTQILLTDVRARGVIACRLAQIRTLDGPAEVFEDVRMEVLAWGEPQIDPYGAPMRVPETFRWLARDAAGNVVLEIEGTVDAPWRHGHGRGYATAYSYRGVYRSEAVSGSAYMEWVDVRRRGR